MDEKEKGSLVVKALLTLTKICGSCKHSNRPANTEPCYQCITSTKLFPKYERK